MKRKDPENVLREIMSYLGPKAICQECPGCQYEMQESLNAIHKYFGPAKVASIYKALNYKWPKYTKRKGKNNGKNKKEKRGR